MWLYNCCFSASKTVVTARVEMELSKWEIFQHLDPAFAADVKRAYLVGISSFENDSDDGDEDTERG